MKLATIVGARPQFIKAAMGSRHLRKENTEILIHTGQHFDENMSDVFFEELSIPKPDYRLNISGGSHAQMTARMLTAIEPVLVNEAPDAVLVYGDTNSTLAASLTAVKLSIPVIHVEAGNRLGTIDNPEEANRIVSDHLASLDFAATETAFENLKKEGLAERSSFVGNIMYDAYLYYSDKEWNKNTLMSFDGSHIDLPDKYYYMTCHRQENTADERILNEILYAMNDLDAPTIYPVHPRNRDKATVLCKEHKYNNIILIQPVGYIESIHLLKNAIKVVTDSGGLQCEAFYAGVQCIFVFDHVVWPETMVENRNQLAKADHNDIIRKLAVDQRIDLEYKPFGDGHAAEKICQRIKDWYTRRNP